MSISRIDQPEKHNHGYFVRLTRDHKTVSKFFADKANGGKRIAKRLAKEHEAELKRQAEANVKKRRPKPGARNTSGIVGVSRGVWEESGRKVAYWQASWIGSRNERKNKKFSVNKYGEEAAKRKAIKARREGLKEREAKSRKR